MIVITSTLLSGEGSPPKDLRIGSFVQVSVAGITSSNIFWEIKSFPDGSYANIANPNSSSIIVGPLDSFGVYVLELVYDVGTENESRKTYTLHVVQNKSNAYVNSPSFRFSGGGIVNCTFELIGTSILGAFPGWSVSDLGGILDLYNGISRGSIVPSNFSPTIGTTAACLGDDSARVGGMHTQIGTVFSITQRVDLTNVSRLQVTLKAVDR